MSIQTPHAVLPEASTLWPFGFNSANVTSRCKYPVWSFEVLFCENSTALSISQLLTVPLTPATKRVKVESTLLTRGPTSAAR